MFEAMAEPVAAEPIAIEPEPQPIYAAEEATPALETEPRVFEPLRAAGYSMAAEVDQAGFEFEAPAPTRIIQPVARIVDPSVAEDEDEPLFAPSHLGDDRRQKGGFLSLFGRPRREQHPAPTPLRSVEAPPPAESFEETDSEEREDLEIPSFLRRLAN